MGNHKISEVVQRGFNALNKTSKQDRSVYNTKNAIPGEETTLNNQSKNLELTPQASYKNHAQRVIGGPIKFDQLGNSDFLEKTSNHNFTAYIRRRSTRN